MTDTTVGPRAASLGVLLSEVHGDGNTLRDSLMRRALQHARTRDLMQHMVQRHAMHRRMMHRATRRMSDD